MSPIQLPAPEENHPSQRPTNHPKLGQNRVKWHVNAVNKYSEGFIAGDWTRGRTYAHNCAPKAGLTLSALTYETD
jgi:hypothetical protein